MIKRLWVSWRFPLLVGFSWSFGADYGLGLSPWSWRWVLGMSIVVMAYILGMEQEWRR